MNFVEIPTNSELKIIENNAFDSSSIESIEIPTSVVELKKEWCSNTLNLNKFNVMPNNEHYSNIDNDFIVGKSDLNSNIYDILVFARRNIIKAKIPPFIKVIRSHAFEHCEKLKYIEIKNDSELHIINENAFAYATLKRINLPNNLTRISDNAFFQCSKLNFVQTIGKNAFYNSPIRNLFLPHNITQIGENTFYLCDSLQIIGIDENLQFQLLGNNIFQD